MSSALSLATADHSVAESSLISRTAGDTPDPNLTSHFFCVLDGLFVLHVSGIKINNDMTSLMINNLEISRPLLLSRRSDCLLVGGRAPVGFNVMRQVHTISMLAPNSHETVHFDGMPLPVSRGPSSIIDVLQSQPEEERVATTAFLFKTISSFSTVLNSSLASFVKDLLAFAIIPQNPWTWPLNETHRYCNFRITDAQQEYRDRYLPARVYFFSGERLTSIVSDRCMLTRDGSVHLLLPGVHSAAVGTVVIAIANALFLVDIRPQNVPTSNPSIETIAGRFGDEGTRIKHFLLGRCSDLYQARGGSELLALGNLVWALTEFPSRAYVRPEMDFGVSVENILVVPGEGVLLIGWLWDPNHLLESLVMVDGQGREDRIGKTLHRYDRPDVRQTFGSMQQEAPGFIAFHRFDQATERWPTYQVKGMLRGSGVIDLATDIKASRRCFSSPESLLSLVPAEKLERRLFQDICPAVTLLQSRKLVQAVIRKTYHFYGQIIEPAVSVVVPIYRRLEHARHQLCHFARDPCFESVELIYVLDSPEQERDFVTMLDAWARLYRRSVTLAVMQANGGYASSTNAGASIARGEAVVLLNSDVIPVAPAWLHPMKKVLDGNDSIGAVGALLFYEDGSIQHAGMAYEADMAENWKVVHPGKGLRPGIDRDIGSGPVAAVTAACMMMRTAHFRQMGGLSTDYIIGDFEDSDLCQKLILANKQIWLCAEARLYHLERQSMGVDGRYTTTTWRYNQMLHQERWGNILNERRSGRKETSFASQMLERVS